MSLSTAAKDYIASHFGSGTPKCFVSFGISYRDPASVMQTGSTQDVVSTLKMNIGGPARGPGGEVYIDIPDWSDINDADIVSIGLMQSGASQYCVGAVQPPPVGDKPVTGPIEVYVGGGESCPPGAPSVTLDTSEAFAFFKSTPYEYIGVGGIEVHNQSAQCRAYFAWEARVWDGYGYITCPVTVPEMQEITRYLAEAGGRPLSLTRLDASETDVVWGSFEVPPAMEGGKTICLSLWGNYDYEALLAELNAAGYFDKT